MPIFSRVDSLLLKGLKLWHCKNYTALDISFNSVVNCFVGLNGSGKTNLLDAIYYLCYTKSHFHYGDQYMLQHDAPFMRMEGVFEAGGHATTVVIKAPRGGKKTVTVNGDTFERITEYIGRFPAVMIAPDDNAIILGGAKNVAVSSMPRYRLRNRSISTNCYCTRSCFSNVTPCSRSLLPAVGTMAC